ncbi:hypothetical protein VMCG_03531 [Cytospora schulzeri]|uniref:Methyltransferase domain-containing protein n=1 Tax=Cytospora schulzeri TaxID=448051 RepID=A0A423WWE9_9PEZI|nr:hypothetical protein VMCG_03531 [Valsa malicola]
MASNGYAIGASQESPSTEPGKGYFMENGRCGTGMWSLDVAKRFFSRGDSLIHGVDLSTLMQASQIYPNNKFEAMDIEEPWHTDNRQNRALVPGTGWIEHVEVDWNPYNDTGPVSPRLRYWIDELFDAMDQIKRPLRLDPPATQQALANAGFVDIKQEVLHMFVNGGAINPYDIDVGRWFNLCLHKSFMNISLAPFFRVKKWKPEQIEQLKEDVLDEIGERNNRSYCKL